MTATCSTPGCEAPVTNRYGLCRPHYVLFRSLKLLPYRPRKRLSRPRLLTEHEAASRRLEELTRQRDLIRTNLAAATVAYDRAVAGDPGSWGREPSQAVGFARDVLDGWKQGLVNADRVLDEATRFYASEYSAIMTTDDTEHAGERR